MNYQNRSWEFKMCCLFKIYLEPTKPKSSSFVVSHSQKSSTGPGINSQLLKVGTLLFQRTWGLFSVPTQCLTTACHSSCISELQGYLHSCVHTHMQIHTCTHNCKIIQINTFKNLIFEYKKIREETRQSSCSIKMRLIFA